MMRHHVLNILKALGGGEKIGDAEIIAWAQEKVASSGKATTCTGFKDPTLNNSRFLLELIDAIQPETVDWNEYLEADDGNFIFFTDLIFIHFYSASIVSSLLSLSLSSLSRELRV